MELDVAIIGGGPAGTTVGTLLRKYGPDLKVGIFEREVFPRDHIGESLLPGSCGVLNEMGCWEKIEAAGFPIKIGAGYRWGKHPERWNFDFFPADQFVDEPRPAKYEGQRVVTSFQVDRAIYDEILLDHAADLGCTTWEGAKVLKVHREGDRVTGLELEEGEKITARHYVDASGNSGILRRELDVECHYPPSLKNIAIYDYWQNAEWAVEIGAGATRIQILTVGYGWLWFIPLGPTRTSIGLVVPVDYFKASGKTPQQIYDQALSDEKIIAGLIRNAKSEDKLTTTRDWSFVAKRHAGENWFLVGESAGFADPILSAGVTVTHVSALQLAYAILELDRGEHDAEWLKREFESRQTNRIKIHIRFGDYWYTANEQFQELKEFTSKLARDMGVDTTPEGAWMWIAQGGFIDEDLAVGAGGFPISLLHTFHRVIGRTEGPSPFAKHNHFTLDLTGAQPKHRAEYRQGRVIPTPCYVRRNRVLPAVGPFALVLETLKQTPDFVEFLGSAKAALSRHYGNPHEAELALVKVVEILEGLISDGWVKGSYNPKRPLNPVRYAPKAINWEPADAGAKGGRS